MKFAQFQTSSEKSYRQPIAQKCGVRTFQSITLNIRNAELTKYTANSMLVCRISFMNELANVAEKNDAYIELVRKASDLSPRIGYRFLCADCADVKALIRIARDKEHIDPKRLNAVESTNDG